MSGKTILVIDDEPRIVEILDGFLTLQGFEVRKAYDGKEGLDILRKTKPVDLIILDEKMPGMGGADFLKGMKELKIDIPVVILTGSVAISQLNHSSKKAYDHILVKPVRLSELLELINEILTPRAKRVSSRKAEKNK